MAQAAVEFQKLLNLEQERHLQEQEKLKDEEKTTTTEISFPLEKTMKELNQNIFSDDKAIKSYNNSKVKARNFLTNVSYNRITTADYKNKNFVIDCFTFMILYLNPFYLERKFETNIERDFVNVLWTFLMPSKLYNHITGNDNMKTLNKIKIKYQDAKDIMIAFLFNDPTNINILSDFLEKNAILYQFLFGNLFPKCFCRINDYGINAKTLFNTYYHNFNVQKNIINWQNKQEEFESPINMTTLNHDDDDENKENIEIKKEEINGKEEIKEEKTEKKEKKKVKRKIKNEEVKKQKREAKKQRLLEQLNENTEKLKKLKKKK